MGLSKLWQEFKAFAFKGNMIDLAVAVVIGAAFSGVINSLVKDIIMPSITYVTTSAKTAVTTAADAAHSAAAAVGVTSKPSETQPATEPAHRSRAGGCCRCPRRSPASRASGAKARRYLLDDWTHQDWQFPRRAAEFFPDCVRRLYDHCQDARLSHETRRRNPRALRADDEGMPLLPLGDPHQSPQVRPLHGGIFRHRLLSHRRRSRGRSNDESFGPTQTGAPDPLDFRRPSAARPKSQQYHRDSDGQRDHFGRSHSDLHRVPHELVRF